MCKDKKTFKLSKNPKEFITRDMEQKLVELRVIQDRIERQMHQIVEMIKAMTDEDDKMAKDYAKKFDDLLAQGKKNMERPPREEPRYIG